MQILTIGHSTRSLEEFLALLAAHDVRAIADVRRYPGSRRHPHFAGPALAESLKQVSIEYVWFEGLGGRHSRKANSKHTAWRVPAFAGYADHMESEEFSVQARALMELGARQRTAVLCAEAVPERCHRRLIADWLVAHDVEVLHILSKTRLVPHELTPFARRENGAVIYDLGVSLRLPDS